MDLQVDRADLRHVRVVEQAPGPLEPGQARLKIDAFGLTANNITYGVFGDAMSYWEFFPGPRDGATHWGRLPVWGFAEVVESSVPGLGASTRVYGYFPLSDELVVHPGRIDDRGFTDVAPHREPLPSVYNRYSFTGSDPIYRADAEALQLLLWPLFVTSFVVDDFLGDHDLFGAGAAVISSASAKTSIAAAFLLARRPGVRIVGVTSPANLAFVAGLGCYDRVVTYDDVGSLEPVDSCFIDVAGRNDVTGAVHAHLGDRLRYSMVVGDTHWEDQADPGDAPGPLAGPRPVFLFAPDQIAKRRREWGRAGFERTVAAAWDSFVPWIGEWLTIRRRTGPTEVESAYRDLLEGRVDPRVGDVCTLAGRGGGASVVAGVPFRGRER
jgi:hypothetical protein